jgi:hypothetical protein
MTKSQLTTSCTESKEQSQHSRCLVSKAFALLLQLTQVHGLTKMPLTSGNRE